MTSKKSIQYKEKRLALIARRSQEKRIICCPGSTTNRTGAFKNTKIILYKNYILKMA